MTARLIIEADTPDEVVDLLDLLALAPETAPIVSQVKDLLDALEERLMAANTEQTAELAGVLDSISQQADALNGHLTEIEQRFADAGAPDPALTNIIAQARQAASRLNDDTTRAASLATGAGSTGGTTTTPPTPAPPTDTGTTTDTGTPTGGTDTGATPPTGGTDTGTTGGDTPTTGGDTGTVTPPVDTQGGGIQPGQSGA